MFWNKLKKNKVKIYSKFVPIKTLRKVSVKRDEKKKTNVHTNSNR